MSSDRKTKADAAAVAADAAANGFELTETQRENWSDGYRASLVGWRRSSKLSVELKEALAREARFRIAELASLVLELEAELADAEHVHRWKPDHASGMGRYVCENPHCRRAGYRKKNEIVAYVSKRVPSRGATPVRPTSGSSSTGSCYKPPGGSGSR
jgi:hypothetical protein